jgi:hypothetical protein
VRTRSAAGDGPSPNQARKQLEPVDVREPHNAEMTVVQGDHLPLAEPFDDREHGRIDKLSRRSA